MIHVPIFVNDLEIAHDFYCNTLPFKLLTNITKSCTHFCIEGISKNSNIQIVLNNKKSWDAVLKDRSYWIQFSNVNVWDLYNSISGKIPEHDGPAEEIPNGYFYGVYESPGGVFATIYDPFGTRLDFFER